MAHYIDKDALLEYLNKLYEKHATSISLDEGGVVINDIEYFLDTLEVKEVDLEKEIETWMESGEDDGGYFNTYDFAKYFFERGLKTQKGE